MPKGPLTDRDRLLVLEVRHEELERCIAEIRTRVDGIDARLRVLETKGYCDKVCRLEENVGTLWDYKTATEAKHNLLKEIVFKVIGRGS